MKKYNLYFLCLIAAMGGLLFGYDFVVIGGAKPFYEPYFNLVGDGKEWLRGAAMSSAVFGCIIGAVAFLPLPDRWGRKPSLVLAAALFTVSAIWTAFATSFWSFMGARVLGGLGMGLASNVSPVYIAEVSPPEKRGAMVAVNQFTIVIGIAGAQLANYIIYCITGGDGLGWRIMFGAETVPALAFFILSLIMPESPMWLESRLASTTGTTGVPPVERAALNTGTTGVSPVEKRGWFDGFGNRHVLGLLALGVFLAAFQQWCGINVVFNYAEEVFKAAGYNVSGVMLNQVITGAVNFVATIVAIWLMDRWGRRPLMLLGAGGLAIIYGVLGAGYHFHITGLLMLVCVLAACACFSLTLGPTVWVLLSELFPTRVRGTAMSICVATLWTCTYLLTLTFPPINKAVGPNGSFWLYGIICAVAFVVIFLFQHETKGRVLEN